MLFAHLGVQEGGSTVRGHIEVAGEAVERPGGVELLDGEEERDALASGQLHGDGGVVDAVLLLELDGAVASDLEVSGDLYRVGKGRRLMFGNLLCTH